MDDGGREICLGDKVECHRRPGRRHRALTCLLFDEQGRLLFARRSPSKLTWPGYWDATVATHQAQKETDEAAAQRRVGDELRVDPGDVTKVASICYYADYSDRWCEREACAVLLARLATRAASSVAPVCEEIDQLRWISLDELGPFIAAKPVAPWFHLAWEAIGQAGSETLKRYSLR